MSSITVVRILVVHAACAALLLGTPASRAAGASADAPATIEYQWFSEGTPAGTQTVAYEAGGRIVSDMRIRWNNRDFELHNEMQLDARGYVLRQALTGRSAFGATIDESFRVTDDAAHWQSTSEAGSASFEPPALYVPGRTGATESIAALVRKGIDSPDGRVSLLPAGTARVRRVTDRRIGERGKRVTLYSVTGLRFAPVYAWLDEDERLFNYGFWGLSMIPVGWDHEVVGELERVRAEFERRHYEDIARSHAEDIGGTLIVEDVDLVDVRRGKLVRGRDVVIENGVISDIAEEADSLPGAARIDGRGKTLIPGLWDMHAHTDFFSYYGGILNIAGGVVATRDMGSDHDAMMRLAEGFESGALVGPAVYQAGFIDKTSPYSASRAVDTFEQAVERVNWYADHGYMQIKLYSSIDPAWVRPLATLAHERGMRVGGHVPAFMTAEEAVRQGFDEIQHINMLFLNFLVGETDDTRTQLRFYLYGDEAGKLDLDSPEVREFLDLLEERGTVIDPTVAVFDSMIGHRAGEPNPAFTKVVDRFPIGEYRSMHSPGFDITEENAAAWDASRQAALHMIGKLHDRGIRIVPGTDALPGFALHRELELYAEAGIPNDAILRIATLDAARVAGAADELGSIEPGKRADLVLLDGNPLERISAVRRVSAILAGGRLYRPEALLGALGIRPAVADR